MYRTVWLLISSLLLWSCQSGAEKTVEASTMLPYYNEPTFTPLFLSAPEEIEAGITHKISPFKLLNQDSLLLDQHWIEGKIHVASFIFTTCGSICPTMVQQMQSVSKAFEKDDRVGLLSFSVTPWYDTPAVMQAFKKSYEISDPNWHFLTGKQSEIYQLARQAYFAEEDIGYSRDSTDFLHTEHLILVDADKRIRGIYNGTLALDVQQLIADIHCLRKTL
ncbi:SCO family protein [Persicobacter psychrovividus]|uniref:SCO family protein n=1 Tax=Persicobacter psychrovividus TaxID=387638 RepID=UPI0030CA348B